jgi:hypothetical protein
MTSCTGLSLQQNGLSLQVAVLRLLIDVARGLDYLHGVAGVVHGDVKAGGRPMAFFCV